MSDFVTISGELSWVRCDKAETDPWNNTKWKATIHPDAESLPKVMDMQAKGCRNTLKKDDKGYYVTFSRPTVMKTKKGDIPLDRPLVFSTDGQTEITDMIGNGSKGSVKVEMRSFKTPQGGTGHSARLHSVKVDELLPFGDKDKAVSSGGF